jgi:septal ring factor EnvC (AmiA/AmiB activator)
MPSSFRPTRRRLAVAASVLACALTAGLLTGPSSSAQTEQLQQVRVKQNDIHAQLDDQNAAIDSLLGEVAALSVREDKVAGELAEQEAELADARADLAEARETLARTKAHLHTSLGKLRRLLVSIYRNGEPDAATLLLNSDSLDELASTSVYLERIRDYQSGVITQVRDLRDAANASVDRISESIARMEKA